MSNRADKEPPDVIVSDTENATQIHPSEAPRDKQRKFRKFRAYNTGLWNGKRRENKDVSHQQDNLHRYDSIASALSLTSHQKSRGRRVVKDFDFEPFDIDRVLFAICVLVANADVADGSRYYPHPKATGDECFEKVGGSLELGREAQISAVETVRERTDL